MYCNTAESFGKQWQVGDVVGVFLDLIDHTISKNIIFTVMDMQYAIATDFILPFLQLLLFTYLFILKLCAYVQLGAVTLAYLTKIKKQHLISPPIIICMLVTVYFVC